MKRPGSGIGFILVCLLGGPGFSRGEEPPDPVPAPPPLENPKDTEPAAETVPLPAERPSGTADRTPEGVTARVADDLDPLTLLTETPTVAAGERAIFSLYGPEAFLRGAVGHYALQDEYGRQMSTGTVRVQDLPFSEGKPRQIQVLVPHPIARQHVFTLSLMGVDGKQVELQTKLVVALPESRWERWLTLISAPPPSGDWKALRDIGVRGCVQYRLHPAVREALRKRQVPFYVENVSRQLLSRYHTERGLWEKTLTDLGGAQNGGGAARDPSLCSAAFAESFAREVKRHAEAYAKEPPLWYSLASEPSMTRLSAAVDFDFSPEALAEFQRWLERDVYGTLAGLNSAWETKFAAWNEVVPMTTDEARVRLRDRVMNFSPWVDFRDFQDHVFSKVLKGGAELIRQTDPAAKVGITGALGPAAFGGWDWSRLSQALDVVECYDIGGARALWRDLAPGKPAVAMLSLPTDENREAAIAEAARTLWSFALEGGPRGAVLWNDPAAPLVDEAGAPVPRMQALAPLLSAMEGETGLLLSRSARTDDGVAILYSPASIRLQWLLEADKLHGDKWLQAWGLDTAGERRESPQLRLRESWGKLLDDLGLSWRYISSAQLERKEILKPEAKIKTLVLPRTIALSEREISVLKQFVAGGGQLVADALCGRFDEHGRLRQAPPLDELFGIDSSGEPQYPKPMNPLESLKRVPAGADKAGLAEEIVRNLGPVYSDEPKWTAAGKNGAVEYRGSPVLATGPGGVYLNLDLTDYLRWRLHPDQPQASATRTAIEKVAFRSRKNESPIDWEHTRLPEGTQLIWLRAGEGSAARILALRRNSQARLHELGGEGDGNWSFEKPEPFSIALRAPAWVAAVQPSAKDSAREPVRKIEGTLDPVTPSLFALHVALPARPALIAPASASGGELVEIKAAGPQERMLRVYAVRVIGPDGAPRPYYARAFAAADGAFSYTLPVAWNDPPGAWQVEVREIITGFEQELRLEVKPKAN